MHTVEVPVRSAKGEPRPDDEAQITRFSPDARERLALRQIVGDSVSKVYDRPFKQGYAWHVIRTFYCEKGYFKLCARRNRCRTGADRRNRQVNSVDASGSDEAGGEQQNSQLMFRCQHCVCAPPVIVRVQPAVG